MDKSNGYERIASEFLKGRGTAINGIGKSSVFKWAKTMKRGSVILDIGCGTGIPVSKVLIDECMVVYGIDASPTLAQAFHQKKEIRGKTFTTKYFSMNLLFFTT